MADPDFHLRMEITNAALPVFEEACRAVQRLVDAMGGVEAIERAIAAREAWEAQHPGIRFGQQCHCWCQMRGHHGLVCDGDATTFDVRMLNGQPVRLFLCQPCADQVRA